MSSTAARIAAAIAAWAAVFLVSSCGEPPSSDAGASAESVTDQGARATVHNGDDVTFARNMAPHHEQAVEMSAMVPSRTANPELLVVARHISLDQQAEIVTFQGLLAQWGEPAVPDQGQPGGMTMSGMVDASTMNQLRSLRGPAFDDVWMRSMIEHHQGAITMAQAELAHGQSPEALHLADMIITAQQREIARMNDLLAVSQ